MNATDPTPTSAPTAEPTCVGPWSGDPNPVLRYDNGKLAASVVCLAAGRYAWDVWRDGEMRAFAYGRAPSVDSAKNDAAAALRSIGVTLAGDAPTLLDEVRRLAPGFAWSDSTGVRDAVVACADSIRLMVWLLPGGLGYRASAHTDDDSALYRAGVEVTLTGGRGVTHPTLADAVQAVVTAHGLRRPLTVAVLRAALAIAERPAAGGAR